MISIRALSCVCLSVALTRASNFLYEDVVLTKIDTDDFSAIAFGDASQSSYTGPRCKAEPGDLGWPLDTEWAKFNTSLEGRLLRPVPPAAACYDGLHENQTQCDFLLGQASMTRFYANDPLTVFTEWPQGSTCPASLNATGNCRRGGFPLYVVNASSVRDIQLAVNFARNKKIRLNIK